MGAINLCPHKNLYIHFLFKIMQAHDVFDFYKRENNHYAYI